MADKQKKKQEPETPESKSQTNAMNHAILGGIIGAGLGLLSTPGTGKKVVESINQSDLMRTAGNELRKTTQQIITEQLMLTLRQTAAGYRNKYEGTLLKQDKGNEQTDDSDSNFTDQYEELKEENKNLNEHLQRIEEKLDALLDDKK